ncbi:competence protein CoiA [Salinibacillus xinjiangensis]|uniref:Competence protein CoiA n=1 Tax=Salinibacillus xinjiangensis TaxID=1229268 RepID=A0A6G1X850_9BACI|nr:competence protein CoiA family protein [Salinibacillus xinjiangensis]MRG87086.1 hypothetical protein [Salinibacillus xinjiangensis]
MLKALNQAGQPILLMNKTRAEMNELRKQSFYCPGCKEKVFIRAGDKVVPHYAHFHSNSCSLGYGEGEYHRQGKLDLYKWLQLQGIQVELEYYIPKIRQRPDLLLKWKGWIYALEFQCAVIPVNIIRERTKGYLRLGIQPIWILGENRIKWKYQHRVQLTNFESLFLQQLSSNTEPKFLIYHPRTKVFTILTNPYPLKNKVYGHVQSRLLTQLSFSTLFNHIDISTKALMDYWLKEKMKFRTRRQRHYSKEDSKYLHWLYQKGLHPQSIPSEIHLPLDHHYLSNTPVYIWQSEFLLNHIHPLSIGEKVYYKPISEDFSVIPSFYNPQHDVQLEYLLLLERLQILTSNGKFSFYKKNEVLFPKSLEQAINNDKKVMKQIVETIG